MVAFEAVFDYVVPGYGGFEYVLLAIVVNQNFLLDITFYSNRCIITIYTLSFRQYLILPIIC